MRSPLLLRTRVRALLPPRRPALGRGRGASSGRTPAVVSVPGSEGRAASRAGGQGEPRGLHPFDHRLSRRRPGRWVSVGGLRRWICGAASRSRRRSRPSGHRPGCRVLQAGTGPGRAHRQRDRAEWCSRAEGLEGETRKGGWNESAKEVRGLSPGSLPRLAPAQNALGLGVLRGSVFGPHVSAQREPPDSTRSREAAEDRAGGAPRPGDLDPRECHLLYPDLAASVHSRHFAPTRLRVSSRADQRQDPAPPPPPSAPSKPLRASPRDPAFRRAPE